jgi:hypothetical protein
VTSLGRIIVSYRREDCDIWAEQLEEALRPHFAERLFMNVRHIDPGLPWETVLNEALSDSAVRLVIIGREWLSVIDRQGT